MRGWYWQRETMRFENPFKVCPSRYHTLCLTVCAVLLFATATRGADCGEDTELRVSAPAASQGSLLLVELRSPKPLSEVAGKWTDEEIPFWQSDAAAPKGTFVWRALLGVDLEQAAGEYKLSVTEKVPGALSCVATINVKAGKFATEKLKVAPNFVTPDPEQFRQAEEDRKKLREIFATITPDELLERALRVPLDGRREDRRKFRQAPRPERASEFPAHRRGLPLADRHAGPGSTTRPGRIGRTALLFRKHRRNRPWLGCLHAVWPFFGNRREGWRHRRHRRGDRQGWRNRTRHRPPFALGTNSRSRTGKCPRDRRQRIAGTGQRP